MVDWHHRLNRHEFEHTLIGIQSFGPSAVKALSSNHWTASELQLTAFFDHREIMLPHITEYFAKWIASLVRKKEKGGQLKERTYYQNQPEIYIFS